MAQATAFFVALLAGLIITPLVRRKATQFGFVDRPDGGRKAHDREVALGGGAAVLAASLVALVFAFGCAIAERKIGAEPVASQPSGSTASPAGTQAGPQDGTGSRTQAAGQDDVAVPIPHSEFYWGLLMASLLIGAVGLFDDFVGLPGQYKLIGQIAAAAILIYYGLWIDNVTLLGHTYELTWWSAFALTMVWLLGSMNALNLIDGIDGLAASVGIVLCLAAAAITSLQGNVGATLIALALAGALLGFLRYNFAPASIFLGDAGSMLVGLVIGSVAIHASLKTAASAALAVPFTLWLAVWSIPILDSGAAILRRMLTGRSLFAADRGHLHHSLLIRGWSVRQAVLFIGLICLTTCAASFLSFNFQNELIALATVFCVVIFLIVTKTFGHIELALLKDRFRRALVARDSAIGGRESHMQLQGSRDWQRLWAAICERAPEFALVRIALTINIPSLHEVFYAKWDCAVDAKPAAESMWRVITPLTVDGETVGKVEVYGAPGEDCTLPHIAELVDFLEPLEDDIRQVVSEGLQKEHSTEAVPASRTSEPEAASPPPTMRPQSVGQ